ncbi:flippase [Streptococcus hyointestinalis]|uniref:flippase n=1 Tax=Streptococcus hyointestinalis TaxID=1337 RepID=UPI003D06FB14
MKLLKNYFYNATYQIIAIIIPLITVPYISRSLGPESVGINSYTNSIMTYFVLFANLGMTVYGNRAISYSRDSKAERSQKFWEIVAIKFLMAFLSFIALMIFIQIYQDYKYYLMLQSVQLLATAVDISWFFAGLEEFKKTVVRNMIVKLLSTVAIFLFVHSPKDLGLYILLLAVSTLLGNLTLWTYLRQYVARFQFKDLNLIPHLSPVMVLFVPQLATSVFMTLNKIVLGNLSTLSQTGYFDNSDKVVRILLAFITAIGTVIFPRIANSFAKKDHESVNKYLSLSFNMVNLISFPVVAGVIAISSPFSSIYFGSDFKGIDIVLALLVIELIFMGWSSVLGNQFLVAINRTKGLTVSIVCSVVVSLCLSMYLVPTYGAVGAAISSVIGEFTIVLVQLWYVKKFTAVMRLFEEVPIYFIASVIMLIACKLVGSIVLSNLLQVIVEVITGGLVYGGAILLLRPKSIHNILHYVISRN